MKLTLNGIDLTTEVWGTETSIVDQLALKISIITPTEIDMVEGSNMVLSINGIGHNIINKESDRMRYVANCYKYTFYAHGDFDQDGLDSFIDYEGD